MDLAAFLRKNVDILSDLDDQQINALAQTAELLEFDENVAIIRPGEIGRFLWIVYEGDVEVNLPGGEEGEEPVSSLERGEIIGEMSILTGEPTAAHVIASQKAKLIRIPRDAVSQAIASNLKTLTKFTKLITRRLLENEKHEENRQRQLEAHRESVDPYDLDFSSVSEPMKILVLNTGSSSLKYSLFDTAQKRPLLEGLVEKIGSGGTSHKVTTPDGKREVPVPQVGTISDAFGSMINALTGGEKAVVRKLEDINAVGHRVVHGGKNFSSSVIINPDVKEAIRANFPIAPLHNPFNLEGIDSIQKLLPGVPEVAVFDTSFHATMPNRASMYALPLSICEQENIRRYGFHGTNHRYVALSAATFLKVPVSKLKMISCHLGSGASVCAIDHGQSIDTSMGMTPLEGLIMGTRAGDVDPGAILHLMRNRGMTVNEVDTLLNKESGLKGLSGRSNDMREIMEGANAGDTHCEQAIASFCYRLKKYIGSYIAALEGLDVLIFTGGIGENSPDIRARVCQGMDVFGIEIDYEANRQAHAERGQVRDISAPSARVRILIIPADEEKMIARETIHALGRAIPKDLASKLRSKSIPLSTSAHHVHLCREHMDLLFGPGRELTSKSALSQPGQFAAAETVNLIGPKGRIEKVRILGPLRKESQVEISRTEQFKLGIDAPIRDSGDLEGTPGVIIEGDSGHVDLPEGVISAKRHIHMSPSDALELGLMDRDVVMVRVKGIRELIFGDVLIRVNPSYAMDMHLDTDEANAAQIDGGATGSIEAIQHRHYI